MVKKGSDEGYFISCTSCDWRPDDSDARDDIHSFESHVCADGEEERRAWDRYASARANASSAGEHSVKYCADFADMMMVERRKRFNTPKKQET